MPIVGMVFLMGLRIAKRWIKCIDYDGLQIHPNLSLTTQSERYHDFGVILVKCKLPISTVLSADINVKISAPFPTAIQPTVLAHCSPRLDASFVS
jgi:hypothetical protein